jgi:SAM-dependent methyltransferase
MASPKRNDETCPSCGAEGAQPFYEAERVPVHCCQLIPTREAALKAAVGRLRLTFCEGCGLVRNSAFDPTLIDYDISYEDDQAFSPRFREFATGAAQRLIDDYGLRGKDILEIGCGGGYFLSLITELGENRGIGIDPACRQERRTQGSSAEIRYIEEFYSDAHRDLPADLIVCRHTLEHLPEVRQFVKTIRESVGERSDSVIFFEVPDVARVLDEFAFWDFYYEHCSYFSLGSLARLFHACDFEILRLRREFDGQYLLIDARPGATSSPTAFTQADDIEQLAHSVRRFKERVPETIEHWRERLRALRSGGHRAVLWGAGSKAVGMFTALGEEFADDIEYVVDINPRKAGMYLAGTGQKIVTPEFLQSYSPDLVIIMNPIYLDEISAQVRGMGLSPEVIAL